MTNNFFASLVYLGICAISTTALYEGDPCTLRNGASGTCKIDPDCPEVERQLTIEKIFPTTCGFKNLITPIVCCPHLSVNTSSRFADTSDTESPYFYTKVKKVCETYAKYNYSGLLIPIDVRREDDDVLEIDNIQLNDVKQSFLSFEDHELLPNRVYGGIKAIDGEFPHMAALGFGVTGNIQWLCGGSLISDSFVLTAAHCLVSRGTAVGWVRLGCLTANETGQYTQQIPVSGWFRHEKYKMPSLYNDIALLKLARRARFDNFVRPACIHPEHVGPEDGGCIATGWGGLNDTVSSSFQLQKVVLAFQNASLCNNSFQHLIKSSKRLVHGISDEAMLCVGETDGKKDTCQGDSGGPIQVTLPIRENMYGIVGVTSFGLSGCGQNHVPAIYTRVSHFVPWIVNIVWPQEAPATARPQEKHVVV